MVTFRRQEKNCNTIKNRQVSNNKKNATLFSRYGKRDGEPEPVTTMRKLNKQAKNKAEKKARRMARTLQQGGKQKQSRKEKKGAAKKIKKEKSRGGSMLPSKLRGIVKVKKEKPASSQHFNKRNAGKIKIEPTWR